MEGIPKQHKCAANKGIATCFIKPFVASGISHNHIKDPWLSYCGNLIAETVQLFYTGFICLEHTSEQLLAKQ